ncbi:KxYKxGKxW signal peptide domain-containing protein [Schleiferilactobacillus shenzhenensis]|uniref:Uncharacterized protein n=1 Tax=Schleiferilactobacillus shenzhenensis LY-73 TaxID=1231336 RepID=U4TKH0_9LACO|nr:KxYKxGKxW signal peptide domain-containing protein [Schleiferilactobacillus shenzhenensis]ERL64709.1 hypothetical protein L248_0628 [Schleiferilactobacillus shenzhenensis LY-73]
MNQKVRYRLYKTGKRWVAGALVVSLLGPLAGPAVVQATSAAGESISRAATIKKPIIFVDYFSGKEIGRVVTDVPKEAKYVVQAPRNYAFYGKPITTIYPVDETPLTYQVYSTTQEFSKQIQYKAGDDVVSTWTMSGLPFAKKQVLPPPNTGYQFVGKAPTVEFLDNEPFVVQVKVKEMSFELWLVDHETGEVLQKYTVKRPYGTKYDTQQAIADTVYRLADGEPRHLEISHATKYQLRVIAPKKYHKTLTYQYAGKTIGQETITGTAAETYDRTEYLPTGYELAEDVEETAIITDDTEDIIPVVRQMVYRTVDFRNEHNGALGHEVVRGYYGDVGIAEIPAYLAADYRALHPDDLRVELNTYEDIQIILYPKPKPPVVPDPDPEPEKPIPPVDPDPDPEPEPEIPDPEVPDPEPEPENPDPEIPDPGPEPETPDPEVPDPEPEPEKPVPPVVVPPIEPDPEVDPPGIVPPIGDLLTMREARQVVAVKQTAVLYKDKAAKVKTDRVLGRDTRWQAYREVVDADGQVVGYHLGGEQFVKASDAVVVDMTRGVFTVRHPDKPKWAIATWTTSNRPVQIIKAGSRWQTFGKRQLNDGHWYHDVGGGQYVRADHGTWQKK